MSSLWSLLSFFRYIAQRAARSLFDDDDEEDPDARLDLDEFDLDNVECDLLLFIPLALHELMFPPSDKPLRGQLQEFDFDTDDEEEEEEEDDSRKAPVGKRKKSKQAERPLKIIPTASDASSSDSDASEDDDEERVTMANMEARSKALDARAAAEAELDAEELRGAQEDEEDEEVDMDGDADEEGNMDAEPFHLPTTAEREEEKARGGPDLQVVQRRMRECVRVLEKFSKRAEKGR